MNGELILNSKFDNKNILLGGNNTGKSTFVKLLLYALGVNINNFIEEIAKEEKCNAVSIAIQTKSDNRYVITRKLPYTDIVNIFPVDETGVVMTEEVLVYNLEEYSDFLLEEELYPKETISYGQGKTASLQYYFLLRGAVVDQTTPHARILSNLSGERNDYIASQPLVNTAIIEKILSRNTAEIQKLRLSLKAKEKERSQITVRIFLTEIVSEKLQANPDYPKTAEKIRATIGEINVENSKLSTEKYDVLTQLEQSADKQLESEILGLKKLLNTEKERHTNITLNISDTIETQNKLKEELAESDAKIIGINNELNRLKESYLSKLESLRAPLQEIIEELKERIRALAIRKIALTDLLAYMQVNEKNKNDRKQINEELKELQDAFEKASQKSADDIKIVDVWIQYYNEVYNEIFGSPKDKDLDMDKYKRFLSLLNKVDNTQIFLTGSVVDEVAYKETIPTAYYLPSLSEEDRLLKSNQN